MNQPNGNFTYYGHNVEYKIGLPLVSYSTDWRIPYHFRVDNGEWVRVIGYIPLRMPDIKKTARGYIHKNCEPIEK